MPVIRKVVTKQTGHRPILINFDNSKVKPESVNTLEAQLYETVLSEKLIAVTSNKLLYTGEVEDDELYHNFIVIHKRDSDQITLFQYDRATVQARFNKKRKFEISPIKDNAAAELNKQFGSKKAKRVTEQRERLTMNIDAVKQQLEQTVAGDPEWTRNLDSLEYRRKVVDLTDTTVVKAQKVNLSGFLPLKKCHP